MAGAPLSEAPSVGSVETDHAANNIFARNQNGGDSVRRRERSYRQWSRTGHASSASELQWLVVQVSDHGFVPLVS